MFSTVNRKLHYYLGLYFLLFIWLFSFTGLLLNHHWHFAEFFPNRKTSTFERPIDPTGDVMRQLGIHGEVGTRTGPDFTVTRPGYIYQIKTDLARHTAKVTVIEYNTWGILHDLHTFSGTTTSDPKIQRDWILTTIWAISMDAVAAGLILMVFSSYYMWWVLPQKRTLGLIALVSGTAVCTFFVFGLRLLFR